jgi:hypothetical protein
MPKKKAAPKPASDAAKKAAVKKSASADTPGTTKAVTGKAHPDHDPGKNVIVATPGPEAAAREKELAEAAERTVYVAPGEETKEKK